MLSKSALRKIIEIQRGIESVNNSRENIYPFSRRFCMLLQEALGYERMLFSFLKSGSKRVDKGTVLYGLSSDFLSAWISVYQAHEKQWEKMDAVIFSRLEKKRWDNLQQSFLKPFKCADFMLQFVLASNSESKYISYFAIASDHVFSDEEIEIINEIKPSISACEETYVEMWELKNRVSMLMSYIDFFPLGVMLVEDVNQVTFTNDLAKQYLRDLGVERESEYSSFFTTELYHYSKYELFCNGPAYPVRIKNYLFNIVPITNPAKNIAKLQETLYNAQKTSGSLRSEMTICIFIINDDLYHTKFSVASLTKIGLTKRECDIVELLSSGMTDSQIAAELSISAHTVRIHISNIFKKMGVKNRVQLLDKLSDRQHTMGQLDA